MRGVGDFCEQRQARLTVDQAAQNLLWYIYWNFRRQSERVAIAIGNVILREALSACPTTRLAVQMKSNCTLTADVVRERLMPQCRNKSFMFSRHWCRKVVQRLQEKELCRVNIVTRYLRVQWEYRKSYQRLSFQPAGWRIGALFHGIADMRVSPSRMYEPDLPLPFCLTDSAIITSLLLTITWKNLSKLIFSFTTCTFQRGCTYGLYYS